MLKALFQISVVLSLLGILINTLASSTNPPSKKEALLRKEGNGNVEAELLCLSCLERGGGIHLPWPALAFPPFPLFGKVTGFKGLGMSVLSPCFSISGFLACPNSKRDLSLVKAAKGSGRNLSESNYLEEPSLENWLFRFRNGKFARHANYSRGHLDLYQLKH